MIEETVHALKHKWFVPCLNNRCYVVKNGQVVPSRLQLEIRDKVGMLPEPHYRCEQRGCEYHRTPKPATELEKWCSRKRTPYKSSEGLSRTEMETMI